MRRLGGFLLVTALLVMAGVWLADQPDEITIRWQGWRIDTKMPILLLGLLFFAAFAAGLGRMARSVVGAPGRLSGARQTKRTLKGYRALSEGLAAVATGDTRRVARLAHQAEKLLKDPSLTGLLSVQAARMGGDESELRARFETMLTHPETAFLGLKGLTDLALRRGERDHARDYAARAFALQPSAEGLASALFDLQAEAGLWAEAEITLTVARRYRTMPTEELARRRAQILYARAQAAEDRGNRVEALDLALAARKADPSFIPAVVLAAEILRRRGKERKSTQMIQAAFRIAPHPALVAAWIAFGPNDTPLERVKRVQRLVEVNQSSSEGQLALAEAALDAKLWGQARTRLNQALSERPSHRVLTLLARLEREENKDEKAALAWLAKAGALAPDPV
ncbi:heme biosynthesis protein HemY [Magnetospirillum molischianum]|uniref:Uncharacterized enzyme of heme biosynthesis n=1 Tax=Magnetospirillum molischianum DSM 120 TaxID=1150626 RepID=H8FUH0_MAGML|nr:heme biosynthesis HemY N-terminal domain-containing protein [Magnetospirillum molischianum]CCG42008.1 Uncharacterized enzyme of heme biosynthesis [Magnetospirillum molischianum DSM 120]